MLLTTFHPGQDFEALKFLCDREKLNPIILSYCNLPNFEHYRFIAGNLPSTDDRYEILSSFLQSKSVEDEITVIDWENIAYTSSMEIETSKQVLTDHEVYFSQEPTRVQDFRLPPFMENLIMISQSLGFDKNDHLYQNNPKVLTPKMIKGTRSNLLKAFNVISSARHSISDPSISAILPIINCNFTTVL